MRFIYVLYVFLYLSASVYRDESQEDEDGSVVGAAGDTQQSQVSGPEALARMKAGTRVVRGKDWKWGDQVCTANVQEAKILSRKISLFFVFFVFFCSWLYVYYRFCGAAFMQRVGNCLHYI